MQLLLMSHLAGVPTITKNFLSNLPNKKILFVPTTGNVESYTGYIDEGINMLGNLGYNLEIVDIASSNEESIKQSIADTDCICVSGGNVFYLLQEMKKKELLNLLVDRINEGMLYIGESAGAILVSKSIEYCEVMDDASQAPELTNYNALGVFDGYVVPHYGEMPFKEAAQSVIENYKDKLDLIPINNKQAVIINNGEYKVLTQSNEE